MKIINNCNLAELSIHDKSLAKFDFIEYVNNKLGLRFQLELSLDWARFG